MGRRLIVDTNILIELERNPQQLPAGLHPDDELAVSAVTRAELLTGVELARSTHVQLRRRAKVERILAGVETLDYTGTTAEHHALLLAHTRETGTSRVAHDLIIAAHARESGRPVLSKDSAARFGSLPGVHVVEA
ncbi:MAG: PIN domain-containing protein [Propionibacteriaceae bacterium]|nr:PIN domain-containing protein [Propionibacteriaceae bacterium]